MLTTVQVRILWAAVIVLAIISFIVGWIIRDIGISWLGFIVRWILPVVLIGGTIIYRSRATR